MEKEKKKNDPEIIPDVIFFQSSENLAKVVNSWTETQQISPDEQQDKHSWSFTPRMLLHAHPTS